ncbi:MAG TPA: response regulator, partial [Polyangiaceae bacterium LLY-WYZ-15_(1-7)]|nr:response regulator [Polyangiaceae bacterium LLY-WYZ-15_(1-7)]
MSAEEELARLRRRLERERQARLEAERLAEEKTWALFRANEELKERVAERTRELEAARDQAVAVSEGKSEFLAMMSHEIRTPMNAILGMTELALDGELSTEQRSLLRRVLRSSEALLHLFDDLLDVSRLDAGQMPLRPQPFEPAELVEDVCVAHARKAAEKHLRLICDVAPSTPARLRGDRVRLRQVVANLLSNAVKFTDAGEVVVRVGASAGELVVTVQDTGPGIPEALRERIFERFVRAPDASKRGTGLGLHICHALMELQGGSLAVESEVGVGSVFAARLPLVDAEPPARPAALSGLRLRALVSDGAPREAIEHLATRTGASLECVYDDAGLAGGEVDAVLIEVGALHGRSWSGPPAVVFGSPPARVRRWAERLGAAALDEPLALDAFVGAVARVTGRPTRSASWAPVRVSDTRERAWVLLAEDDPDNRGLLRRLLEREGCRVDVAPHGELALERVRRRRYDLILTDVQMPRLDGPGLARAVRAWEAEEGLERTPIVAVTAHALEAWRRRCAEAGMDEFVAKPVRTERLRAVLERWLDPRPVVLVVEDDPESRALVARQLRVTGRFRVSVAADGEQALELAERRRLDLVLLDLTLPGLDGFAVARSLRARHRALALLALSGHEPEEVAERAARAGIRGVLRKPIRGEALRRAVGEALGQGIEAPVPAPAAVGGAIEAAGASDGGDASIPSGAAPGDAAEPARSGARPHYPPPAEALLA